MIAHDLDMFCEEGLVDDDGRPAYELVPDSYAPFGFEQLTLWQTMKERGIDITMDVKPSTIAYLRQQGREIYVIAGWRNHMPFFVLGPRGVDELAGIKGLRVGVIDHDDILMTMLSYWLQQAGLDPQRDVEWVTGVDTRRAPEALRSGRCDVAFADRVNLDELLNEGYSMLFDVMAHYPNGRPDRVVAATGRAIDEHPDQVKAFVKGMIRAYWFVRTQENFALTHAIEERLRRESTDADERRRMAQFGSGEQAEAMPFPIDGLPTGLEQYLAEAVSLGVLPSTVDPTDIARTDLAVAAFSELRDRGDILGDFERVTKVVGRVGY
jgi:ABC-type nitrate/sulfonate/bicarbonate transport system substrate-binding protein